MKSKQLSALLLLALVALALRVAYFPVCHAQTTRPLVSEQMERELRDPFSPIKFAPAVNEYQLVYQRQTNLIVNGETNEVTLTKHIPLRYCPWTGKELPTSNRPDMTIEKFQKSQEIRAGIANHKTMNEIRRTLGEPDYIYGSFSTNAALISRPYCLYPPGGFKEQFVYTKFDAEFTINVIEDPQNRIQVFTIPQGTNSSTANN